LLAAVTFFLANSLVLQGETSRVISVMGKRAIKQGHGFATLDRVSAKSEGVGPLANFAL